MTRERYPLFAATGLGFKLTCREGHSGNMALNVAGGMGFAIKQLPPSDGNCWEVEMLWRAYVQP